jgi:hypothetical protein
MAKKNTISEARMKFISNDIASWNFIIFLTLSFMLLVAIVTAMKSMGTSSNDIRSKAADNCEATVTTCDKGKAVCFKGLDGCPRCVCSQKQ